MSKQSTSTPANTCTNCGSSKQGEYCSVCGQNSRNYLRAAHRVIGELLGETLEFDSRVFRSLRYLVLAPGFLSIEFSAGRRARYISPVRLYLVVSLVFFFLLSVTSHDIVIATDGDAFDLQAGEITDGTELELELEAMLQEKLKALIANPSDLWRNFLDNLPLTMFVLLPFSALLLKATYPRRYYSEHFVFALHVHAFVYLVLTVLLFVPEPATASENAPAGTAAWQWLRRILQLGCVAYAFVALKQAYRQSLGVTMAKGLLLSVGYLVLLTIGLAITGVATFLLY